MLFDFLGTLLRRAFGKLPGMVANQARVSDKWVADRIAAGLAYQKTGDIREAESAYLSVLAARPNEADALHLLATIEHGRGNLDHAEELARRALAMQPRAVEYLNTLGTILGDSARHEEALQVFRDALQIEPDALRARTNLLFLLNLLPGLSREAIFNDHIEWARIHVDHLLPTPNPSQMQNSSGRELAGIPVRVGYVSGDWTGRHPVGRIMAAVLPLHDRGRFRITCYDNTRTRDHIAVRLRACVDSWVEVRNLDDESLADRIRRDRIDVLVDLSGHTRNNRLLVFARRPAALQVSWLGYLNTTGMRAMDWRIIAEDAELPGSEKYHSERLWTLPGFPWPWVPPEDVPKELDCDSGLGAQRDVTFGSFNAFRKLNGRVLAAWAEILRDVPGSRLHIYGVPSGMCVERTHELFEGWGIEAQRVSVFGKLDYQRYLSAYDEIDIALDTFPYTGGATTCESLWMGVPLITLAGAGGFGRSSTCFVRGIGFPELACESIEQYQRAAVDLALNDQSPLRRRREFRERVRAKLDPSPENFIRGLEAAFFGMLAHARDRGLLTC